MVEILYVYPSSYKDCLLQVKLMSENEDILRMAAEQFLGKSVEEVQDTIIQVTSFSEQPVQLYISYFLYYIHIALY